MLSSDETADILICCVNVQAKVCFMVLVKGETPVSGYDRAYKEVSFMRVKCSILQTLERNTLCSSVLDCQFCMGSDAVCHGIL